VEGITGALVELASRVRSRGLKRGSPTVAVRFGERRHMATTSNIAVRAMGSAM